MCRLAAYFGEPIFLDALIARPRHSLLRQALRSEEGKVATHGDGFGVGWYGEPAEPGVYREAMPAWGDDNLAAFGPTLRSRLFFAHVRAATAGAPSRQNCHPFRHGRHLFMHNGQVGGYPALRRTLEARLPDALFAARRGATDSELLFLLIVASIEAGAAPAHAVLAVLDETRSLMQARGVVQPLRFAAVLADGERMLAFRLASDDRPPSLYLRHDRSGTTLASEPLDDAGDGAVWQALPPGSVVEVDMAGRRCRLRPLPAPAAMAQRSAPATAATLGAADVADAATTATMSHLTTAAAAAH